MRVELTAAGLYLGRELHPIIIKDPESVPTPVKPFSYNEILFPGTPPQRTRSGGLYNIESGGQSNTVLITSPHHISACLLEGKGWILTTGPYERGYYHLNGKDKDKHFVHYGQGTIATYVASPNQSSGAKFLELCQPVWAGGEEQVPFGTREIKGYSIPIAYWDFVTKALTR